MNDDSVVTEPGLRRRIDRFFDERPKMTIWLIAGIALSGIVCMCLITALVVVFSQV